MPFFFSLPATVAHPFQVAVAGLLSYTLQGLRVEALLSFENSQVTPITPLTPAGGAGGSSLPEQGWNLPLAPVFVCGASRLQTRKQTPEGGLGNGQQFPWRGF